MHKLVWIYLTCVLAHKLFLGILTLFCTKLSATV